MHQKLVILLPGKISPIFFSTIEKAIDGYSSQIVTEVADIPPLQNRKILWAVELNEYGFNLSLEEMLQRISQRGQESLKNSQGAVIIQSPLEIWTKYHLYRIIFQTNQLGCRYIGHPAVEATRNLVNFLTWQKKLKIPLIQIYQKNCRNLVHRLVKNDKVNPGKTKILVLYSNSRKTSNTMMLWEMVKNDMPYYQENLVEQHVENGTIVDCHACLYKTCKHYSERKSCFYGGIVVQEILPAIEKADCLIWLCPNYNDAVSAKLMAVINRLTVLYKRVNFYTKSFFTIIVSGNSGSENVAMQLIGALNVNKGFHLPANFSLMAIANDPGAVKQIACIQEKARDFAKNICKEIGIPYNNQARILERRRKMKALLIVDVQNDFIKDGALAVEDAEQVIPIINQLMDKFDHVLATKDWHPTESIHFEKWPPHCIANTKGAEFPLGLKQEKIKHVFYKGTGNKDDGYSAFEATNMNLIEFLKEKKISELYISGIALEFCVKSSALDALQEEFKVFLVRDAIATFSKEEAEVKQQFSEMEKAGTQLIDSKQIT